jgi:hypothetical protein
VRRHGAAAAAAVAALTLLSIGAVGCETPPQAPLAPTRSLAQARASLRTGLGLYESSEYSLAARRFQTGAEQARSAGDAVLEKRAITAECTSWLRGRRISEFAECTQRLERLQRREGRSDPGINTLLAFGAIAGERPLPQLTMPNTIQSLVRQAAVESSQ